MNEVLNFIQPKDAWDKLSMREKAEMMKVAVRNGIYNLNDIREKYNEFAEGGAVTNEIAEDYQPLVSDSYQPIIDSMKASNAGFNVDDYAYRVQKMHPEITREQVQSLYNATPYIASDKVKGTYNGGVQLGGYKHGDANGFARMVKLYPNAFAKLTGTEITPSNANAEMGDTFAHETNHLYTQVLLGGSNDEEKDILWEAYRPGFVVQDPSYDGNMLEERAINAEIRNRISRENGNVTGTELDKAIDNTPDDVLMNMLFDPNNGYINQSGKKHMQDSNGNWNRTDAVRRALKDVAFNQTELSDNYAALGGPLVQAANEYRHGGGIHIKKENRGKFTRLKERTGHSASWFKEHGTPAQKKMAVFELNARKWKHGLGGNLFEEAGQMQIGLNVPRIGLNVQGWPDYSLGDVMHYAEENQRRAAAEKEKPSFIESVWNTIKDTNLAYIDNPAVMTASGQTAKISETHYPTKEEQRLASNLYDFGEGALGAITASGDIEALYNVVRHPVQTARAIKSIFSKGTPAAEWASLNNRQSFIDDKPEIGMYLTPDGKSWNIKRITEDLGKGITDARIFLGSDIKAASDAHNIELAKRLGFPKFTPYLKAQERASVGVSPKLFVDKNKNAGYLIKNIDPHQDEMGINIIYDADKGGFHETLHKGNYGEEGFSFEPETTDFMNYHKMQNDTRGLYQYKTNKLLVPRTTENAEWHDYMSKSAEAATNSMEVGRRMGLEPGAPWPGRKKAMELFERYAASSDQKTKAFNVLNWKQKPRRVWDALTGRYFVLGAGTISSASLIDK